MTASVVEVGLRKKEKAKRPSESEEMLLGWYIRLGSGSREVMRMSRDKTVAEW